jgi:hypothetical protein
VSYDLAVYVSRPAEPAELLETVTGTRDLALDGSSSSTGDSVVLVRGVRARYCFTVGGPFRVEAEDVPYDVTAAVLGVSHMYTVMVEGSAPTDVPYAVRFTRRLAQTLGGAVVDQQTDEVWSRGSARVAAKPNKDQRIAEVDLRWYVQTQKLSAGSAAAYVDLARKFLPEALPRRYGEYEPFQHKLAEVGDEGFGSAWRTATSLLFFSASTPCIGGSMWAGPADAHPRRVWTMSLSVHAQALADELWRDALRRLFIGLAERLGCFYASAEVTRGHLWNGRSSGADSQTEWPIMPVSRTGWLGLPPYPMWWAWYGGPYLDAVSGPLDDAPTTASPSGRLHEWTDLPADRDQLAALARPRRRFRRTGEWMTPNLLSTIAPNDGRTRTPSR